MPLSRLLTLIVGVIVILAMTIWLITSLNWLYGQIAWSASPFLANLLLLLLIVLLAVLIGGLVYYLRLLWMPSASGSRSVRPPVRIPDNKSDAASVNLKAVRSQVDQIQDEVARQALRARSQAIESNLSQGNLQVVVFGTGSAGKSSVVNAILGRVVGRVSAPMGTTTVGETYTLNLPGLEREILITDTPGILESGIEGNERGEVARQWATEADLLLFVVDNDLRQSEYEPLQVLAEIGKRSIVAFNKADLYAEGDREVILARLRARLRGIVPPSDIVAISANPPVVRLVTGEAFTPDPEIMPLIRRIVAVLRAEGEDLLADNILLQSQRLGDEARRLLDGQRRRQAMKIVDRYQWIGAGAIAITPLPGVDLLATAAVNAQMVVELGKVYGCELNLERGRELALSLGKTLASLGIVKGVVQLVATGLQFNVGTLVIGKAIQGVSAAYLTRIAGKSFIEYFRQDGDWGDGGITEVVQRQFELTQKEEFVKAFIKDAVARVVEPLQLQHNNAPSPPKEPLWQPKDIPANPIPAPSPPPKEDWGSPPPVDDGW
ncbi:YcjF family protein [Sodalinema gerasimenkoae]|uniref:YcjF family protein n=1 Tax=Sodalinema gerasimenkoae TaxID=2862348 RepID=UPI001359149E|nr:GTP-binding protein [Sodalinema gerasimenkoae]